MLSDEEVRCYRRAGEIARKVLKLALDVVEPEKPLIEICERLEQYIIHEGGKPAFPINISINEIAAHYTSPPDDVRVVPPSSVVKVDVGVHVNGYIVDAAITLSFDPKATSLVMACAKALDEAIKMFRVGVRLGDVGRVISKVIRDHGYRPIENLTGHLIARYRLHAGKSVPNVYIPSSEKVNEGEVYAIEPFSTSGIGRVRDGSEVYIFSLILDRKKMKKIKDKEVLEVLNFINSEYHALPFTPRWLVKKYSRDVVEHIMDELRSRKLVIQYPVLIEVSGGIVAQFEDTVIVWRDHIEPLVGTLDLVL
ncbi:MAG: type II methionyl aminopeptidase [Thermoprotei archaeon]|nr:MAG: type II methionyl aminopeptidase [Thermoprotei archaeon]